MNEIRELIWNASLNIQIDIDDALLLKGSPNSIRILNVRIPRDTYTANYIINMLKKVEKYLNNDIDDVLPNVWLEFEDKVLPWNYPVGTLFDIVKSNNKYTDDIWQNENTIQVWKLKLRHGELLPQFYIPIVGGVDQIEKYWMHQWKQVCFILNGSSKRIMALSMKDSKDFWNSIIARERSKFEEISKKVKIGQPRNIPVIVHLASDINKIWSPKISVTNETGLNVKVIDLVLKRFPNIQGNSELSVVCNGIDVPTDAELLDIYNKFHSFDGFLHISINDQSC